MAYRTSGFGSQLTEPYGDVEGRIRGLDVGTWRIQQTRTWKLGLCKDSHVLGATLAAGIQIAQSGRSLWILHPKEH